MISIKQLNYALAVGKTLHFKNAAELCSVSQSALSTAITELEKQLGVQLFERDNKRVLITPAGEQLLEKAHSILLQVDDLYRLSQVQKSPLSVPMKLGVIPTISPYLLPKVLPNLRQQHPDFRLSITEGQSHELIEMVKTGELDTAILALPYPLDELLAFEFWQEDFYWVAPKDAEFADCAEISSQQLRQTELLLLKDGHCLKEHALAACKLSQQDTIHSLGATSLHTIVQMVAGRMGTTLLPEMALDQLVTENSELCAIHLNEPGPHRRIAFVIRPNYIGVNDIERLKVIFKEGLKQKL
jgi:transcriptional regulator, LysR family